MKKISLLVALSAIVCVSHQQSLFAEKLTESKIQSEAEGLVHDSVNMATRNQVFEAYRNKTTAGNRQLFFHYYAQARLNKCAQEMAGADSEAQKALYKTAIRHLLHTAETLGILVSENRRTESYELLKEQIISNRALQNLLGYSKNSNAFYPLLQSTTEIVAGKYKK